MEILEKFSPGQIEILNDSSLMAEELVSNYYKMSSSQWLGPKFDLKTLKDLDPGEIVHGPFAQIIRYSGKQKDKTLGSAGFDFYKICLQDHAILSVLGKKTGMDIFPFSLYIITHELIHIVRFGKFLQRFEASHEERMTEEHLVHRKTHEILKSLQIQGMDNVLDFYDKWRLPSGAKNPGFQLE